MKWQNLLVYKAKFRILIVLILAFVFSSTGFSQRLPRSISGVVVDTNGATIADALLILSIVGNESGGRIWKTKSDIDGRFIFDNLLTGQYRLKISHLILNNETEKLIDMSNGQSVTVTVELGRACNQIPEQTTVITEKDKTEIVRLALREAINRLLTTKEREKRVILSSNNINPKWVGGQGVGVWIMRQENIQKRADRIGDFLYLSFSEIRNTGSCVAVSIDYSWAVGKNSKIGYVSGGGVTFEYRRIAGRWTGKSVAEWVAEVGNIHLQRPTTDHSNRSGNNRCRPESAETRIFLRNLYPEQWLDARAEDCGSSQEGDGVRPAILQFAPLFSTMAR